MEKQTAGVEIDLAQNITVSHCSIYDMPRSGVNIGDGCWGGHVIEFCDIFDTVKETGDHGSFNSWGRDRYWVPDVKTINDRVKQVPELPRLDAVKPIILRNNRWRCDHGWDIDLDDGASYYLITSNLCLNGGIKNREGYARDVENNILVNGSLNPHVWLAGSGDIFRHNIVWTTYRPARMYPPPWGQAIDYNLFQSVGAMNAPAVNLQQQSGRDEHSLIGDAQFVDPAIGDYRVKEGSPALALGFVNFPMDQFGVQKPELRAIARTPRLPGQDSHALATATRDSIPRDWLGASVRNIADEGEMSAFGLPGVTGVLVLAVSANTTAADAGLQKGDVIVSLEGTPVADVAGLVRQLTTLAPGRNVRVGILRNQKQHSISLHP